LRETKEKPQDFEGSGLKEERLHAAEGEKGTGVGDRGKGGFGKKGERSRGKK